MAQRLAASGPLGIMATRASAHVALNSSQGEAFAKLDAQYRALYATEDLKEGRRAEAKVERPSIRAGEGGEMSGEHHRLLGADKRQSPAM